MSELEEPEWLQPGMLKDEDDLSGTTGWNFADQRFGAFVFVVAGSAAVILLFVIFLREFYWRKYGVDLCPSYWNRRGANEQMDQDRVMAEELQRRLNDEEREAAHMNKRKERRAWYESFIKDYTVTVKATDLFYAHDTNEPAVHLGESTTSPAAENVVPVRKDSTFSISDQEDEDIDDIERGLDADVICPPVVCEPTEEDAHLFLRLPVKDKNDCCRSVDACCSICFCDYEEGDTVVWSGLECRHAFHDACILPWLSKGKKRCPICRHWFVPGARIEDQKKELEERLSMEAESAGSSETSDETEGSLSDSENQTSTSEISSGEGDDSSRPEADLPIEAPGLEIESGGDQESSGVASNETRQERDSSDIA